MTRVFLLTILTILIGSLLEGCGGKDSRQVAEARIGPDGGSVTVTDSSTGLNGLKLEIPAGALAQPVEISIADGGTRSERSLAPDIRLEPDGTAFMTPVRITVPMGSFSSEFEASPNFGAIWEYDAKMKLWKSLETQVDLKSGTVSANLEHFSIYRLVTGRFESNTIIENDSDFFEYQVLPNLPVPDRVTSRHADPCTGFA